MNKTIEKREHKETKREISGGDDIDKTQKEERTHQTHRRQRSIKRKQQSNERRRSVSQHPSPITATSVIHQENETPKDSDTNASASTQDDYIDSNLKDISNTLKTIQKSTEQNQDKKLQMYKDAIKLLVNKYALQDIHRQKMVKQLKGKLKDIHESYNSRITDYTQKITHYQELKYENDRLSEELRMTKQRKSSLEMQETPDVVKLLNNWEKCRIDQNINKQQVLELNRIIFDMEQQKSNTDRQHIEDQYEQRNVNKKIVESLEYKLNQLFKVQIEKDRQIESVQREKKNILHRLMEAKNSVNQACQAQYAKHKSLQIQQSTALAECMRARHELQMKSDQEIARATHETQAIKAELDEAYKSFEDQFKIWQSREESVNQQYTNILEKRKKHEQEIEDQKQQLADKLEKLDVQKRKNQLVLNQIESRRNEIKLKKNENDSITNTLNTTIKNLRLELKKALESNTEIKDLHSDIKALLLANRELKRGLRQEIANKHEYQIKLKDLNNRHGKNIKENDDDGNKFSFAEVSMKNMNAQLSQKQKELEDAQAQIAQLKLESQHILSIHKHNELNELQNHKANLERKRLNSIIKTFEQDIRDKTDALEKSKNDIQMEKDQNNLLVRKLKQQKDYAKNSFDMNRKFLTEQTSKNRKLSKMQNRLSRQLKTVASIQSSQDDIQKFQEKEHQDTEDRIRDLRRIVNKTS